MKTLHELLAASPALHRLSPAQIETLERCALEKSFGESDLIFRTGDPAAEFYILRDGIVGLEVISPLKREMTTLQTLHGGDILGWSWLFPPHKWHFDARALEPTSAFALDAARVRALCEEDREMGYRLLQGFSQIIVERLQATRLQLLDLYEKP
jgi:CRP/FNR family cyclic AMP-dependent transcriptional regulator